MRGPLAFIGIVLLLAACDGHVDHPPRPAGTLPPGEGAPYRVSLKTYDNDRWDNPFSLYVQMAQPNSEPREVLRTGPMCRNVDVLQTPARLYIFYEMLSVKAFNNTRYDPEPRVLLCDLDMQGCRDERTRLLKAGARAYNVCTYRDPITPDVIEPLATKESAK